VTFRLRKKCLSDIEASNYKENVRMKSNLWMVMVTLVILTCMAAGFAIAASEDSAETPGTQLNLVGSTQSGGAGGAGGAAGGAGGGATGGGGADVRVAQY
jgi:hypothetical protein